MGELRRIRRIRKWTEEPIDGGNDDDDDDGGGRKRSKGRHHRENLWGVTGKEKRT